MWLSKEICSHFFLQLFWLLVGLCWAMMTIQVSCLHPAKTSSATGFHFSSHFLWKKRWMKILRGNFVINDWDDSFTFISQFKKKPNFLNTATSCSKKDGDTWRWWCLTSAGSLLNNYKGIKVLIIKVGERIKHKKNEKGQPEHCTEKHLSQEVRTRSEWQRCTEQCEHECVPMCRPLSGV